MRSLADGVVGLVENGLNQVGWVRTVDREVPTFTLRETVEVVYQLRLDVAVRDYGAWFNPNFSVQHPETSRLAPQFRGLPKREGAGIGTIGFSLADQLQKNGHQAVQFSRWMIERPEDVAVVAGMLLKDIESYAMPVLHPFKTLDDVISYLATIKRDQVYSGHLAIAQAIAGRTSEAVSALSEFVQDVHNERPPMSGQTWRFVRSFVAYFEVDENLLPFRVDTVDE